MRVLVACECSGAVRREFRARGHDAWSCDIQPADDGDPHHFQGNVVAHRIIKLGWDMLIAFPDCTFLTSAGAHLMRIPWRAEAQKWALAFVKTLWALPIKRKVLENPVGRLSTLWKKPTQIIHPWQFGHPESKTTCLWLDNAPPLRPTKVLPLPECGHWDNQTPSGQNRLGPSKDRAKKRAQTYQGIAAAMAEQWGGLN